MLVSIKDVFEKMREGRYAVGQFNVNNLEWTRSVLLTAEELESLVILGVSKGAGKYMTKFKTVAVMVWAMMEELNIAVPAALHLDHGIYDGYYKCIKAGFSSIMFDGSHYPIEENIEKAKELVEVAHVMDLSLETKAGSIGGEEDDVAGLGECVDPREHKIIADLGIDFSVADTGDIHDKCSENQPGLRFDILEQVRATVGDMPLVFRGGTGIPGDIIEKAISLGVAKINVDVECQLFFAVATRKYIEADEDLKGKGFDLRKFPASGADAIRAAVKEKMELFGPVGKI